MVLAETLRFAVSFHLRDVRGRSKAWLTGEARRMATVLATHGDDLQFGGRHSAEAFNGLARGIACASLVANGGITVAGVHWCRDPLCRDPNGPHRETDPETQRAIHDLLVAGDLL